MAVEVQVFGPDNLVRILLEYGIHNELQPANPFVLFLATILYTNWGLASCPATSDPSRELYSCTFYNRSPTTCSQLLCGRYTLRSHTEDRQLTQAFVHRRSNKGISWGRQQTVPTSHGTILLCRSSKVSKCDDILDTSHTSIGCIDRNILA